jgi:hypothetical protein
VIEWALLFVLRPCFLLDFCYTEIAATQREGIMDARHSPTKQQVRDWLKQAVEGREPPPAPSVLTDQLWQHVERYRKQVLS